MNRPSWVALHGIAHSFIELCKPLTPWQGCDPWRRSHKRHNTLAKNYQGGTPSVPFWCLCQKLSLCLLYFNKRLLHKKLQVVKPHLWPQIEILSTGGHESQHNTQLTPATIQCPVHLFWLLCGVPFLRGVTWNQSLFFLYILVYSVRKVEAESGQSKPEFQKVRASGNFPPQRKRTFSFPRAWPSRGFWFFTKTFTSGVDNHQFSIWYF